MSRMELLNLQRHKENLLIIMRSNHVTTREDDAPAANHGAMVRVAGWRFISPWIDLGIPINSRNVFFVSNGWGYTSDATHR
jgi:hypothetical protein